MNTLVETEIAVPVLHFPVSVRYATPRIPTAFESILLEIISRFAKHPEYCQWPVLTIAESLLCAPDATEIIDATINELLDMQVIEYKRSNDGFEGRVIGDFSLTERGLTILETRSLPGRPSETRVDLYYSPVMNRFLADGEQRRLANEATLPALPSGPFKDLFPEDAIADEFASHSFDWYRPGSTRIEGISNTGTVFHWQRLKARACLSESQIVIRSALPDLDKYLSQIPPGDLLDHILNPLINPAAIDTSGWDVGIISTNGGSLPIHELIRQFRTGEQPTLVSCFGKQILGLEVKAPTRGIIVIFDGDGIEGTRPEIVWNNSRGGCLIIMPGEFPLAGYHLATGDKMWRFCRVPASANGEEVHLPLAVFSSPDGIREAFATICRDLLSIGDTELTAAAALVLPIVELIPLVRETLCRQIAPQARIGAFVTHTATIKEVLRLPSIPGWHSMVAEVALGAINELANPILRTEDFISICRSLDQAAIKNIDHVLQRMSTVLAEIDGIDTLITVREAVRSVSSAFKLPYLANIYSPSLVREVLACSTREELYAKMGTEGTFEKLIRQVWDTGQSLGELMGVSFPFTDVSEELSRAVLKSNQAERIETLARKWQETISHIAADPLLAPHFGSSQLALAKRQVEEWSQLLDKILRRVSSQFRSVYIVDTNALIDLPEIPWLMRKDELLVLPKTVLDELDAKKLDESVRTPCTLAVHNLTQFERTRLVFESGDMTLLPPDYRKNGDNLILSVALKYRRSPSVLVTGDRNLILKAAGEDIKTISVEEFKKLHQKSPRTSVSDQGQEPSHKLGKKQKGKHR